MQKFQQSIGLCRKNDPTSSTNASPAFQQPMGNAAAQQMLSNPPSSSQSPAATSSLGKRVAKAGSRVAPANNLAKMGNSIGLGPGKDLGPKAGPFAVGFGVYNALAGLDKVTNGETMDEQVSGGTQLTGGVAGILAGANGVGSLLGLGEGAFVNPWLAAGAAGFGTGLAVSSRGDAFVRDHDLIGQKNRDGSSRSISDWVGDEAYEAYEDAHTSLAGTFLENTWAEEALAVGNGISNAAPKLAVGSAFSAMMGVAGFGEDLADLIVGD